MAKKKINRSQQQKVLSAQHRKAFMQKLRNYCALMGNPASFDAIPEFIRDVIYDNRGTSCTIRVAKDAKITKRFVKILYNHINEQLKSDTLELLPDNYEEITLFDYYQILFPLERVLLSDQISFKGEELFSELRDIALRHHEEYNKQIVYIIYCACHAFCNLTKRCLYTFTYDPTDNSTASDARKRQLVTIGTLPIDVRYVTLDNERRLVYQVGEVRHEYNKSYLEPAEILLSRLNIESADENETAHVYVQQHAIDRITKRAYCSFPGTVASLIFTAFSDKHKILPNGKNQYLIECCYSGTKIGYFLASYIDRILVIRTFLLITHSGTPEGKKLEQLTGLQKRDKAYLALDDLRSLANSDIIDDPHLRNLFVEAGCESILQLCLNVRRGYEHGWLWDRNTQSRELSKLIHEYIQLGDDDNEYFVNEEDRGEE
jgi:predicted house-cleaning noncanonical NTP pyrophosphatase (MazG superfamily)